MRNLSPKQLMHLSIRETTQLIGAQDLDEHFSKDTEMVIKHMKRRSAFLSYYRTANQKYNVISYSSEWSSSKKSTTINAGEGVEKREPYYTVGVTESQ